MSKNYSAKYLITMIAMGSIAALVSGCGTQSAALGQGTAKAATQNTSSQQNAKRFQPSFQLSTSPSSPVAGKEFTMTISMQRRNGRLGQSSSGPHKSGNFSNRTGGQRPSRTGNYAKSGNQAPGGGPGRNFNMSAVITGPSVKKNVTLTSNQGQFTGKTSLSKAGTYTLTVTMNIGPRQIQKQFTIKVKA
ncbi:hypothetical protein [Alicyclobacillus sp. SO9]|uniref:hypothetical protein n=1 Tax=Alicyclobacillus sp. SO9 TaxID=2665646 RepID=UPI0018E73C2E|nr:hypothetical protein [Alicyclobacillus sp. SO9]QQE76881.1 hypothetical protein GI364_12770 [Alicyclobacillus sp. SO9]